MHKDPGAPSGALTAEGQLEEENWGCLPRYLARYLVANAAVSSAHGLHVHVRIAVAAEMGVLVPPLEYEHSLTSDCVRQWRFGPGAIRACCWEDDSVRDHGVPIACLPVSGSLQIQVSGLALNGRRMERGLLPWSHGLRPDMSLHLTFDYVASCLAYAVSMLCSGMILSFDLPMMSNPYKQDWTENGRPHDI